MRERREGEKEKKRDHESTGKKLLMYHVTALPEGERRMRNNIGIQDEWNTDLSSVAGSDDLIS